MGSDDLFKKRKTKLKDRKSGIREPKPNSFLIICEGEKTEPNYFSGIADYINTRYEKSIDVQKPIIIGASAPVFHITPNWWTV